MKNRYIKRRQKVIEMLGGKCMVCGSAKELQIDHIDRTKKEINIGKRLASAPFEEIEEELKKCQLLCHDCHYKKTIPEIGQKFAKGNHGTLSTYRYCRCDECRKAHNEYQNKWKAAHRKTNTKYKRSPDGEPVHGTANAYNYRKCRCEICRKAHNRRMREYNLKKKLERKEIILIQNDL